MGFFKKLFRTIINAGTDFTPDFSKSEYDNWLEFLAQGGTTKEWDYLKRVNNWDFRSSSLIRHQLFEQKIRPVFNSYISGVQKLKASWSAMYNSKDYTGKRAERFVQDCHANINAFKAMVEIEDEFGEDHLTAVEGYKRLAMLYEKQGRFEESIAVCKEALLYGMDERNRMLRMIKKVGRSPSLEEEAALIKFEQIFMSE